MGKRKIFVGISGLIGGYLLHFPFRLLEDWVMGEIGEIIAENWQAYLGFFITWVLPFLIVLGIILVTYRLAFRSAWRIAKQSIREVEKVNNEKQQPYIHVESHDQKGGITAYQVNVQPDDRLLTPNVGQQVKDYLNKNKFKTIEVNAVMGDGEAFRFASQVKNYLTAEGFDVQGVNQVVYANPPQGQIIQPPNDAGMIKIIIGNR